MMQTSPHYPVMLPEVLQYMEPKDGEVYVDGTFGAGGYTRALLESADCKVYAIDRDPHVKVTAEKLAKEFPGRIELLCGNFGDMHHLLKTHGVEQVDGIVLDVGVSSMQLDQGERGFSFMKDGPLDMRMSCEGQTAADFVNQASEKELANVIYRYGGEKRSRHVARAIVTARVNEPVETTGQLARIVRSVVRSSPKEKIDPATRTFQAIRIWINDELGELENALKAAEELLSDEGRLIVVSFHSLEDSIVKQFLNEKSGRNQGVSRHMVWQAQVAPTAAFELLIKKPVTPSEKELDENIRSRSAKLRAAKRTRDKEGE